jgi:eukaryotic-like serine/threonine-protein kinase
VLGTTDYVSPEQAMGEDVDERSDVYSLGVVLYEMLVGDVPFQAETQVGVAMKHVNEPLPDVKARRPEISAAIAAVVERATAKDSRDRYGSVAEMVRDLEQALDIEAARRGGTTGEATSVLDSVPRERRKLTGGRSRVGIAMGIVGVALIVAALVLGGDRLRDIGDNPGGGGSEIKLAPDAATDFDPFGGDGEHAEDTALAVDSNPTGTAWSTESYDVGLEKPGVGLYVDAGDQVTVSAIEVRFAEPGEDVEIRSAPGQDEAPSSLDEWEVIGQADGVGQTARIETPDAEPSRFYLVWLTKLPEGDGGQVAEISDIRLLE